jgi:hypothetical protein
MTPRLFSFWQQVYFFVAKRKQITKVEAQVQILKSDSYRLTSLMLDIETFLILCWCPPVPTYSEDETGVVSEGRKGGEERQRRA